MRGGKRKKKGARGFVRSSTEKALELSLREEGGQSPSLGLRRRKERGSCGTSEGK